MKIVLSWTMFNTPFPVHEALMRHGSRFGRCSCRPVLNNSLKLTTGGRMLF